MSQWATTIASTIIPAQPGWNVLEPLTDETGKVISFFRQPIIAWRVETQESQRTEKRFDIPHPVTIESVNDDALIERPDGIIVALEDRWFESEADALEAMQNPAEKGVVS